jgi:hypothetical protein
MAEKEENKPKPNGQIPSPPTPRVEQKPQEAKPGPKN